VSWAEELESVKEIRPRGSASPFAASARVSAAVASAPPHLLVLACLLVLLLAALLPGGLQGLVAAA
jgi:hypothetical protein